MKPTHKLCLLAFLSFVYFGCSKNDEAPLSLEMQYQQAIEDAMLADESEISNTLWPINSENQNLQWKIINDTNYVLLGNFTSYPDSFQDSITSTQWGIMWVFIPDQFKSIIKETQIQNNDTLLRIRQLLGLPPSNGNTYIVEIWANPADIFRPAADPEITDQTSGLYLTTTDTAYINWFENNIYESYFSKNMHYPWTRLGYTYDWSSLTSEFGASEYCIKKNSTLYVEKLYKATEYLKD